MFITRNILAEAGSEFAQARSVLVIFAVACQAGLALLFKFEFFRYVDY